VGILQEMARRLKRKEDFKVFRERYDWDIRNLNRAEYMHIQERLKNYESWGGQ
jgi:hypothetical protein